ncbi:MULTISPECIES: DnaJ-like cysteine-rich domain-containing protein [Cupriavidus]|uniref:hypothetical protein n=1 Tax=Cupriavidus sp. DF5525 TaxID=3160989 RepID=UPI0003B031EB|nr:hypothetical protein N234_36245 [Ralstonia pickettii DTP0602]
MSHLEWANGIRSSAGYRRPATSNCSARLEVKPQQVRSLSLEGEKDIDSVNPKVLYFHVDGGYPSEVTLYLRARRFSSLYYTELGKHSHTASVTINDTSIVLTHNHTASATETDPAGGHGHNLLIDVKVSEGDPRGVDMQDVSDCGWPPDQISTVADHTHKITKPQIDNWVKTDVHHHSGSVVTNSSLRAAFTVGIIIVIVGRWVTRRLGRRSTGRGGGDTRMYCTRCHNSGRRVCDRCDGAGFVRDFQGNPGTCPRCVGAGRLSCECGRSSY